MLSSVPLVVLFLASSCSFAYTPQPRTNHNSVLIENILLIYGGQTVFEGYGSGNTLIILPIDNSFDTTSPPYSPDSGPRDTGPNVYGGAMMPGGQNRDELFVYGGNIDGGVQLAIYNQTSGIFLNTTWPNGTGPVLRDSHTGVINITTGKAYIFGGETDPNNGIALNDLWVLDTVELIWLPIMGINSTPLARQAHSATLTIDGRMVVIGGWTNSDTIFGQGIVPMSYIDIFDTVSQQWSNVNASNPPQARLSHTAVCTRSNQIIVFGGDNGLQPGFLGDLIVLDMNTLNLSWSTPNTSGVAPAPRYGHSATLVGTIMFIIYGQVGNTTLDSNIYALDTTTFTWTTNYAPSDLQYTWPGPIHISVDNNGNHTDNAPVLGSSIIIIIVISSILGICICFIVTFGLYYYSQHQKNYISKKEVTENENEFFPQIRTNIPNSGPPLTAKDRENLRRPSLEQRSSMSSNPIRSSLAGSQGNFPDESYENPGTKRHSNNSQFTSLTRNTQAPSPPIHSSWFPMQPQSQLQDVSEPATLLLSQEYKPSSSLSTDRLHQRYSQYQDSTLSSSSQQQQDNAQLTEDIEASNLSNLGNKADN